MYCRKAAFRITLAVSVAGTEAQLGVGTYLLTASTRIHASTHQDQMRRTWGEQQEKEQQKQQFLRNP